MKQCSNCNAVLPEGEQNVCLVCGTRQAPSAVQAPAAGTRSQEKARTPRTSSAPLAGMEGENEYAGARQDSAAGTRTHDGSRTRESIHGAPGRAQKTAQGKTGRTLPGLARNEVHPRDSAQLYDSSPETQPSVRNGTPRRRPDKLMRILALVLASLVVLLVVGAGVTYFMYERFNVADAYGALSTALMKGDVAALRELVVCEDFMVTDGGLAALCRAFPTQENVDRLLDQLKRQTAGAMDDLPYPALAPTSDPVFLGYKNYKLLVKPVTLQIKTIAQNTLLSMDGTSVTGEPAEGGATYSGLFPGVYTCTVTGQTALGETVAGAPTDLSLFDPAAPVVFDGALPIANINVAGCLSDDAVIAINGTDVAQKPSGKVVSLPQVALGSTITMRYTTAYGASTTASVQFTDRAQTELAFTGHATEGGVPSQDDLKALFGGFYASYLDALNNADAARITACTEAMRTKLSGDVGKDEVKANVYQFTEAQVNMTPVEQLFLEDGTPTLKLNAFATYKTTKRVSDSDKDKKEKDDDKDDKKETSHTVYYATELAYVDGGWKVNRLAETTKENFDGGVLVPIEG